jgi:RimJ/RimL family protein N-acetyltransferase
VREAGRSRTARPACQPPLVADDGSLVLDRWLAADAAAHRRFALDPVVARYFGWTVRDAELQTPAYYTRVVEEFQRDWEAGARFSLAIRHAIGADAVGAVELRPEGPWANVSYLVDADHRRSGLGTTAVMTLLTWARAELDVRVAKIECHEANTASRRVAEKNGFTLVSRTETTLRYLKLL